MELILGSQSPRRRELLERMGLRFRVLTAEIDETKFETDDPETSVLRICEAKAAAVAGKMRNAECKMQNAECKVQGDAGTALCRPGHAETAAGAVSGRPQEALILASDTIVVLDGKIMGKPHDQAEARAMLASLSGREHAVYTAFCLLPVGMQNAECNVQNAFCHCEKTYVKFRTLTPEEIAAYVATGEPMDKAGAYGIQGLGSMLVEAIRGDYFTVMGLPVCSLALALKEFGMDPLLKQENSQ